MDAPRQHRSGDESRRRSLFYLVFEDPPHVDEFRSYDAKGLTPRNASPRQRHIYQGVSMFETEGQARKLASEMTGRHYGYIAEVSIPEGVPVERQGHREGHCNVYASPEDLRSWVVRVVRVR